MRRRWQIIWPCALIVKDWPRCPASPELAGCVLACVAACLRQAGVEPTQHVLLSEHGVKKRKHADFDADEAECVYVASVRPSVLQMSTDGTD